MYVYITIPRFAEISMKTVGMIPLGLVITISFVCIAFYQYLRNLFDLEICICHHSKLKEKLYCSNVKFCGIWAKYFFY